MSLCLLRTLLPRVMTVTEARRGLILLPIKCSCSAHAYNRGSSPSPIPDLPGIGGPSPSPSPICRGWGVHPHPHPRFAGDGGSIPIPIPDLPGIGDHPHPRFPSGVPCQCPEAEFWYTRLYDCISCITVAKAASDVRDFEVIDVDNVQYIISLDKDNKFSMKDIQIPFPEEMYLVGERSYTMNLKNIESSRRL